MVLISEINTFESIISPKKKLVIKKSIKTLKFKVFFTNSKMLLIFELKIIKYFFWFFSHMWQFPKIMI